MYFSDTATKKGFATRQLQKRHKIRVLALHKLEATIASNAPSIQ